MSDAVNMVNLVAELAKRPRGRACVVLTHDFAGQRAWANELAKQTEADHVDLLDLTIEDEALAGKVAALAIKDIFGLLQQQSQSPVLIVTGVEFLTAAWSSQASAMEQFASHVEMWTKSPALLFVMQHDSTVANRQFTRYPDKTFVVDQKDTLALT